jgi:predicted dinucleotide-binding enzyme
VAIGTRDPVQTLARTEPDARGRGAFAEWAVEHPDIRLETLPNAAAAADLVVVAMLGSAALEALDAVGDERLQGKVLLDTCLPLVRHDPGPPSLSISGDDSLAEQIQRAHPTVRVVKSLTTMAAALMTHPERVPGDHVVFVSGDDDAAKRAITGVLRQFGWPDRSIVDLGELRTARATEQYSYLLFELAHRFGSFDFNIAIQRAE